MKNTTFSLVFGLFLVFNASKTLYAQSIPTSSVGIAINEYMVSNIAGPTNVPATDNFGNPSDWVELISNFSNPVNLNGYYLSNDRMNLYKWPFPSGFTMLPGQIRTVWLTGKNITMNGNFHTNFTIDQCKDQWLILTNPQGVVRDSVFIRRTKEGHTRGRVDYSIMGRDAWRIFTTHTYGVANSGANYIDYAPRPIIKAANDSLLPYNGTSAGFFDQAAFQQFLYIYLDNGVRYDTLMYPCFRVYYTINSATPENGFYPLPGTTYTNKLMDGNTIPTTRAATIVRAITVPLSSGNPTAPSGCEQQYLPSFCETSTFFTDPIYDGFSKDFGVISIAMDKPDTNWFSTSAANRPVIHVEYYDGKTTKKQMLEGYAQINKPINEEWRTKQKGFYMTIDDRRGFGCNFEGSIFNVDSLGTSKRKVFPTLHLKAGDYESHSSTVGGLPSGGTGILDVFYQSLAAKNNLHVNPLHVKPVIAFFNGKYRGVYDLREVYDKYYESYYNQQDPDSMDMMYHHTVGGVESDAAVTYFDGQPSNISMGPMLNSTSSFINTAYTLGIAPTINSLPNYNKLFQRMDKENFIDYMILNSYAQNANLWKYNIALARGQAGSPGNKWHYYMWNVPSIFNFTSIALPGSNFSNVSPCTLHQSTIAPNPPQSAGNAGGNIFYNLMNPPTVGTTSGKGQFQLEYKNRYMDLLNGPLKCDNILKHYDYVANLFRKEMMYMEDPASQPDASPYNTVVGEWDTNVVYMRRRIEKRCNTMSNAFGTSFANCYGLRGPYPLTVDVYPQGAGKVKLNSMMLDSYVWSGNYYATTLTFKAIPADDSYTFHHWEFKNHTPLNSAPLSLDSVAIGFAQPGDEVVAVFTDKKNDIVMPSGFTPNGDGVNDLFQPVGTALFSKDFDMSVWNRWGQEVYRSTDPGQGWDGNFKGSQAQTGVYAYVITYKNIYNESKIVKGNLTLLR